MQQSLHEKYRPHSFADVIGQPKVLAAIDQCRQRGGLAGRGYWITGKPGTGKTTIARLIAAEVAGDPFNIIDLGAADIGIDDLRKLNRDLSFYGLGGTGGKALIINDADELSSVMLSALKAYLEAIPAHAVWCFTTTRVGQASLFEDAHAETQIVGRCVELPLTTQGLAEPMAKRAQQIAIAEGLDGRTFPEYLRFVKDRQNDMRRIISGIESGAMLRGDA